MDANEEPTSGLRHYFRVTRGPWYGFLFALPVLVAYEVLVWVFQFHTINGADAVLTRGALTALLGPLTAQDRELALLAILLVAGVGCYLAHRRRYRGQDDGQVRVGYFGWMAAESVVYALFFGSAVLAIMQRLPGFGLQLGRGFSPLGSLTMALGAGLYEELLFRVLLMGVMVGLLRRLVPTAPYALAWLTAALVSSFVFSCAHYLGAAGDVFTPESFVFRLIAGALLAMLYAVRGFGVAVWTHALFDVLVCLTKGG